MTQSLPEQQEAVRASDEPAGEPLGSSFATSFVREIGALLERALNREIAASTAAGDVLEGLEGQSFAIEVLGLGARCVLRASGERVVVDVGFGTPPRDDRSGDGAAGTARPGATLRATPLDLFRLARAADVAALKGTSAEIVGSPEVAEAFAKLIALAKPDLEEAAARWIGDVPANALARAAHGAGDWLRRAASALRMNTAEFLQEESRALPAALEAQAFYADVDRLRDDVERAAARLALLERRARA